MLTYGLYGSRHRGRLHPIIGRLVDRLRRYHKTELKFVALHCILIQGVRGSSLLCQSLSITVHFSEDLYVNQASVRSVRSGQTCRAIIHGLRARVLIECSVKRGEGVEHVRSWLRLLSFRFARNSTCQGEVRRVLTRFRDLEMHRSRQLGADEARRCGAGPGLGRAKGRGGHSSILPLRLVPERAP